MPGNNKIHISDVAGGIPFDNATNGFTSTDVQAAIEEVGTSSIPDAQVATVRKDGNDSTGVVGNRRKPYLTITAALAAISDNAVTKPYKVDVGPGVYTETLTMKPYVIVWGSGDEVTRIVSSSTTAVCVEAADNSAIVSCLITGSTGSGGIGIRYQGTTGSDGSAFYVKECRLGANETLARVSASSANLLMVFGDCRIGGPYSFTNGFLATTSGAGFGRILLMGCSTNGTTAPQPAYIGYATGAGCEVITNGCQFRASALTSGAGFRCDTGGTLRMSAVNLKNFATAIDVPNTGAAPFLDAASILIQSCTNDVNIAHASCTGSFNGVAVQTKVTNNSTTQIQFQDPSYGVVCNGVTDIRGFRTQLLAITVANTTTNLTATSPYTVVLSGTTAGQIVRLPDATTINIGHRFEFWNKATVSVTIQDNTGNILAVIGTDQRANIVNNGVGSAAGVWLVEFSDAIPLFNLASGGAYIDDFLSGTAAVSTLGTLRWAIFNTGTGAATTAPSANTDNAHIGVANLAVGAVSSISSLILADLNVGGGQYIIEALVRVGTLGNGTNNYVMQFGIGNNEQSTSDPTDGIYFEYSQAGSTQWRVRTTNNSTSTTTATGVTAAANTWYKLKFIINPAASSVGFYISAAGGGATSLVATHTTNIPTAADDIAPIYKIRKTVGTGTNSFDVDYFQMVVSLTNIR